MTNATYAGLRMAARAGKPKPDMEDDTMPEDDAEEDEAEAGKKEKDYMTEDEHKAAVAEATAKAKSDERNRFNAVMASEHYAGREKLAATLLANDKMSADEIITALAAAAPAAPAKADDGDDDAARAAMREQLAAEQPGPTGQAADEPDAQADDSLVANMKARHGLK